MVVEELVADFFRLRLGNVSEVVKKLLNIILFYLTLTTGMKCKAMSPWKGAPLWNDKRPKWKHKGINIIKSLPRGLMIWLSGAFQAYVRLLKYKK